MKGYAGIKAIIALKKKFIKNKAKTHNYDFKITKYGMYLIGFGKKQGFQKSFKTLEEVEKFLGECV